MQKKDVVKKEDAVSPMLKKIGEEEVVPVSDNIFYHVKSLEFNKKIADAEAVVYELKKQKATFIHDSTLDSILKASKEQKQEPNKKVV